MASEELKAGEQSTALPPLEEKCWCCEGEGCGYCNESGWAPTPLGEQILRLIRHNFKALARDSAET